jgi:PTS system cellobiose-specific IIA component
LTNANDPIDWEQTLFTLILHAGNARSKAKEAAEFAAAGDWEQAEIALAEANEDQFKAHQINADIIRMEASDQAVPFSVLLVHSMDLLLLAWSELDYTEQYIKMCQRISALETEVSQWRSQASKS